MVPEPSAGILKLEAQLDKLDDKLDEVADGIHALGAVQLLETHKTTTNIAGIDSLRTIVIGNGESGLIGDVRMIRIRFGHMRKDFESLRSELRDLSGKLDAIDRTGDPPANDPAPNALLLSIDAKEITKTALLAAGAISYFVEFVIPIMMR